TGRLDCVKLEPEPGEVPFRAGDEIVYARRRFYPDPIPKWTVCEPLENLRLYILCPYTRPYVRRETKLSTEFRGCQERWRAKRQERKASAEVTEIPPEFHEFIA